MHQQKIQKLKTKTLGIAIFALAFFSVRLAGSSLRLHSVAAAEAKPGATAITIDNFSYAPMQLEIAPGTQVIWINKDDVPHTVVSVDHKFKSRALDTDESFFVYLPGSRYVRIFLLGTSQNDRQDRSEVRPIHEPIQYSRSIAS